jgi:3-phenylpropionate/trans-cinnamate dioxygenase ferredoxin subunit
MTWGLRRNWSVGRRAQSAADGGGGADQGWIDVGGLGDLRANRLVVETNGVSVLIVRAAGSIVAIENECPHLGSRLSDGQVSGRVIRCAAHGYRWDLATGRPMQGLRGQRRRPLREVPVRLAGDRIMLVWPASRPDPADPAAAADPAEADQAAGEEEP